MFSKQVPQDMKLCQERNEHKCSHDVASATVVERTMWEKKQWDRCTIVHEPLLLEWKINQFVSVAYSFANLLSYKSRNIKSKEKYDSNQNP